MLADQANAGTSQLAVALVAYSLCTQTFCCRAISSAKAGILAVLPLRLDAGRGGEGGRWNCVGAPSACLA